MSIDLKTPVFAALDVNTKEEALHLAHEIKEFVGGFKIGPRLCIKYGESLVKELSALSPVFVDNKYYDIPSVMEASVRATFNAGASFCTVHAGAGLEALKRMGELEKELNQVRPFQILGVTVLTSFSVDTIPAHWSSEALNIQVLKLAEQIQSAGLKALVCSAEEASQMRQKFPGFYLVTPGIRPSGQSDDDQKRVVAPRKALEQGASALVIGRPIYQAQSPAAVAQQIHESLIE